jgi:NADPH:quinone reductase-like Zn-dependent oxidoreductase
MTDGERRMRAVRFHEYGDPSALKVEEVARPEPKAGEVLIRVRAVSVNVIDWMFRAGYLKDFMPLELPHIPGNDVAGTVKAIGADVVDFSPGDEVFGQATATYAEYATASVEDIEHKPATLSFEEAATLALSGISPHGLVSSMPRISKRASGFLCMAAQAASAHSPCSWGIGRVHTWSQQHRRTTWISCVRSAPTR